MARKKVMQKIIKMIKKWVGDIGQIKNIDFEFAFETHG
jgi:hypothetical protein